MMRLVAGCAIAVSADTCSLYQIADGSCGQSDLNCDYVKYAKAAESGLQDGTCADQGYTVPTGTTTKTYPIIGDITISTYSQGLMVADTCSLYQIAHGKCGQSDLNCAYVKMAKVAESRLQDGTCEEQGYTVATGTTTKNFPIVGNVTVSLYSKGTSENTTTPFPTAYPPATTTTETPIINNETITANKELIFGFLEGFLADKRNIKKCETGAETVSSAITGAFDDLRAGNASEAVMELTKVMVKLQPVMINCKLVAAELPELLLSMGALNPEMLKANWADHKSEIQAAVLDASKCRATKDWTCFGRDVGSALRMLVNIELPFTTALPSTAPETTLSTTGAVTTENSTVLV